MHTSQVSLPSFSPLHPHRPHSHFFSLVSLQSPSSPPLSPQVCQSTVETHALSEWNRTLSAVHHPCRSFTGWHRLSRHRERSTDKRACSSAIYHSLGSHSQGRAGGIKRWPQRLQKFSESLYHEITPYRASRYLSLLIDLVKIQSRSAVCHHFLVDYQHYLNRQGVLHHIHERGQRCIMPYVTGYCLLRSIMQSVHLLTQDMSVPTCSYTLLLFSTLNRNFSTQGCIKVYPLLTVSSELIQL